jgi:hypothetical protein
LPAISPSTQPKAWQLVGRDRHTVGRALSLAKGGENTTPACSQSTDTHQPVCPWLPPERAKQAQVVPRAEQSALWPFHLDYLCTLLQLKGQYHLRSETTRMGTRHLERGWLVRAVDYDSSKLSSCPLLGVIMSLTRLKLCSSATCRQFLASHRF